VIRALVFDFDGVVIDTESPVYESWSAVFAEHGCPPLTLDEWAREVGTVGGLDVLALLRERATRPIDEAPMQRRRRAHRDRLLAVESVRPGVVEWLDEAAELELGVAIASSSDSEWVTGHLDRIALRERFAHIACSSILLVAKPAPDTYLDACRVLGVEPHEALAIEDSPNGITAAKAARLTCVAVPNAITRQFDLSAADLQLTSLTDRTLRSVIAQLG
jgi:HAD superfamily hydrolase (TIGR01509 family)